MSHLDKVKVFLKVKCESKISFPSSVSAQQEILVVKQLSHHRDIAKHWRKKMSWKNMLVYFLIFRKKAKTEGRCFIKILTNDPIMTYMHNFFWNISPISNIQLLSFCFFNMGYRFESHYILENHGQNQLLILNSRAN